MPLQTPLSAALDLYWLVNAPFFSVAIDLNKNMHLYDKTPDDLCIGFTDAEGELYQQCETRTSTQITFSLVLTTVDMSSSSGDGSKSALSRGRYSAAVLEALQALFLDDHTAVTTSEAFSSLLSQIEALSLPETCTDEGCEKEACSSITLSRAPLAAPTSACGHTHPTRPGICTGFQLTHHPTDQCPACAVDGEEPLEVSKRVVDSK